MRSAPATADLPPQEGDGTGAARFGLSFNAPQTGCRFVEQLYPKTPQPETAVHRMEKPITFVYLMSSSFMQRSLSHRTTPGILSNLHAATCSVFQEVNNH